MKQTLEANSLLSPRLPELTHTLDQIAAIALKKNVKIITYTDASLGVFYQLDVEKQLQISSILNSYLDFLAHSQVFAKGGESFLSKSDEIECIQDALEEFGFKTWDDDFDFIDEGDIIEIYSNENIQLYRNLKLLELNPYDLLTILTTDWQTLYERPLVVTKNIMERVGEVMGSDNKVAQPFCIPEHTLKAVSKHDQVIVSVNLKFLKPIFDKNLNKIVAFIATQAHSPVLLQGDMTESVSMLRKRK